jgi:hypothetical protein
VDLYQALSTVGSAVYLQGHSDQALLDNVAKNSKFESAAKTLSPALGLEHGTMIRPFDALHELSYVTRPRYQDDILDRYAQWGLMRYLGFFDLAHDGSGPPELKVSDAGRKIAGNQRRVTSEDMGIGFGALLARRWFAGTAAAGWPISIVDIDVALDDGYVYAGGIRQPVRKTGSRRPDYLMIALDPTTRDHYRVRMVECKGTISSGHAISQLASAAGQLGGITVAGRVPTGIAISTITGSNGVSYLAIDPEDDASEPSYWVTPDTVEQVANYQLPVGDRPNVSPTALVSASVRASWATLADFGGNLDALEKWAPAVMRRRLDRRVRERITFETPFGTARGTSISFGFDQQRLSVRYGIDRLIDDRISQDRAERITEAQVEFASRMSASQNEISLDNLNDLHSATSDGSIFSVTLE